MASHRGLQYECNPTGAQRNSLIVMHLLIAFTWTISEITTICYFEPHYDWIDFHISDLGIPYSYVRDGVLYCSPLALLMNTGIAITGVLFGIINISYIWLSRHKDYSRPTRIILFVRITCSIIVTLGLAIVASVHGGPREFNNGTQAIHGLAAALAMTAAQINSILVAVPGQMFVLSDGQWYRYGCLILGLLGMAFNIIYATQPAGISGLFERLTVYMVLLWELWTMGWVACAPNQGAESINDNETQPLLT